jgi:hypothetical protein
MGNKLIGFERSINKSGEAWDVRRINMYEGFGTSEVITKDGISLGLNMGSSEVKFRATEAGAELKGRIVRDVEVDAQIGRGREQLRVLGRLVEGVVVTLTNAAGSWNWKSK